VSSDDDAREAQVSRNALRATTTALNERQTKGLRLPLDAASEPLNVEFNRSLSLREAMREHLIAEFARRDAAASTSAPKSGTIVAPAALCSIKDVGGITIAQKLDTAMRPDMPESAVGSGCIDFILAPEDIAKKITEIAISLV